MGKKGKKKSKNKKNKSRFLLTLLVISLILLAVLIIISFKAWEILQEKKIEKINIEDKCSLFMENILHQIRDLPDCENSCRSECYIIKKDFLNVDFKESEEGCNECTCYCK